MCESYGYVGTIPFALSAAAERSGVIVKGRRPPLTIRSRLMSDKINLGIFS